MTRQPEMTVLDGELFIRASALGPLLQLERVQVTAFGSPFQFDADARALDGTARPVYFRYRWGGWRLEFSDDKKEIASGSRIGLYDWTVEFREVQLALLRWNVHLPDRERWTLPEVE